MTCHENNCFEEKNQKKEEKKHRHRYFSIFFLIIDRHMKTVDDTDVADKFWKSLPTLQNQRGPCCANKGVALLEPQSSSTYATWFSWNLIEFIQKHRNEWLSIPYKPLESSLKIFNEWIATTTSYTYHTSLPEMWCDWLSLSASMKHKSKGFACPASTSSANCRNPGKAFCFRSWIRWDNALRWIMSSHKDSAHLWCNMLHMGQPQTEEIKAHFKQPSFLFLRRPVSVLKLLKSITRDIAVSKFHLQVYL